MPKLTTTDLIHYHAHLARARFGSDDEEIRDLARSGETPIEGLSPSTVRSLLNLAGRVLEISDFVTSQASRILTSMEEDLPGSEIEQIRDSVAEALYSDFDFGHSVETQNGWSTGTDRLTRQVFLDVGAQDTHMVEFGLRFSPSSAEVIAYGTDIDAPAPTEGPEL